MDYRETVMSAELIRKVNPDECVCGIKDAIELCKAQAEISFKVGRDDKAAQLLKDIPNAIARARKNGIREVVEWGNESCTEHMEGYLRRECIRCWQAFKKERGL